MARPTENWLRCRIAFSVIGIVFGFSVFFTFAFHYRNYFTSIWALLSGIAAAITLVTHLSFRKHVWDTHPYRLRYLMFGGCFIQLTGVTGFITYLVLAIKQHQVLTGYGNGFYLTSVWCFMTWKWGFALFYYARSYRNLYYDVYTIVPKDHPSDYESYGSDS